MMAAPTAAAPDRFVLRRLRAERLTPAHFPDLRRMDEDPRLMSWLGGVRSVEQTEAYLARNLAHWTEHGFGIWMLRDPATGRTIGRAGLRHVEVEGVQEVEIAYALLPELWGRGIGTDAARACVTIGHDWLGFASLVALVRPANLPSQHVLRKASLTLEREVSYAGMPHLLFRTD